MCRGRAGSFLDLCAGGVVAAGAPAALLLCAANAWSCEALEIASYPLLVVAAAAALPFLLLAAVLLPMLFMALPLAVAAALIEAGEFRRAVRRMDELDERAAPEEEYRAAAEALRFADGRDPAVIAGRVLDDRCPSRRWYLALADERTLQEVAVRSDDPLAPFAWARALGRDGAGMTEAQIIRLWARSVESDDPFAPRPEVRVR